MEFNYGNQTYNIETVPFQVTVTKFRAFAVRGEERVEIPGAISESADGAEMLDLLSVARLSNVSLGNEQKGSP